MSVQINQYLMYGISVPYPKDEDFYDNHEQFHGMNSAFNSDIPAGPDGIFCLMDGMNGNYMVIGKVLAKSDNYERIADDKPLRIDTLTEVQKLEVVSAIQKHFDNNMQSPVIADYYFITHYR